MKLLPECHWADGSGCHLIGLHLWCSWGTQFWWLLKRSFVAQLRNPTDVTRPPPALLSGSALFAGGHFCQSLHAGLTNWELKYSPGVLGFWECLLPSRPVLLLVYKVIITLLLQSCKCSARLQGVSECLLPLQLQGLLYDFRQITRVMS